MTLCGGSAIAVFLQLELLLVIAQLIEQALAKIAACHAGRVQLADDFERLVQIGEIEAGWEDGTRGWRWSWCG